MIEDGLNRISENISDSAVSEDRTYTASLSCLTLSAAHLSPGNIAIPGNSATTDFKIDCLINTIEGLKTLIYSLSIEVASNVHILNALVDKAGVPSSRGEEPLLKTKEAAKLLNMESRAVREGASRGCIPASKIPAGSSRGQWRFEKEELRTYLKKGKRNRSSKSISLWNA